MTVSNVEFHEDAEIEMLQAAEFYEAQEPGLEQRFLDEIDKGLLAISGRPQAWPVVSGSIRKKVLYRFPYSIFYREEKTSICILAVMHQRRKPNYWKKRLE